MIKDNVEKQPMEEKPVLEHINIAMKHTEDQHNQEQKFLKDKTVNIHFAEETVIANRENDIGNHQDESRHRFLSD